MKHISDDESLQGITKFSASNIMDPLYNFPADEKTILDVTLNQLFEQATVVEGMLVSLHHMQVSVCTVRGGKFTGKQDYLYSIRI